MDDDGELLGIDGMEEEEDGEELGMEGAELGDEGEELGMDGIELLELLELDVDSQAASNRLIEATVMIVRHGVLPSLVARDDSVLIVRSSSLTRCTQAAGHWFGETSGILREESGIWRAETPRRLSALRLPVGSRKSIVCLRRTQVNTCPQDVQA